MLRLVQYIATIVLALGPLMTNQYSLLDFIGFGSQTERLTLGIPPLAIVGSKAEVEMTLRIYVTLLGIGLLVLHGYFDAYLPSRTLENFRHDFLEQVCKAEWRKRGRVRSSLRINVMYLRWRLHMPFGRSFKIVWKDNFEPRDGDGNLRLYEWQGVCGKAARTKEAVFVDLRTLPALRFYEKWLCRSRFRLAGWQLNKTCHLKAILSVPIFLTTGPRGQEKYRTVGVIDVDATTDADVEYLAENAKDLAVFLAQHGTLVAKMR